MPLLFGVSDPGLLAAMFVVMFASAVLQTTTGFGFAILSAPIAATLIGGPAAVSTIIITGTAVDMLILVAGRHERLHPDMREVVVLGISSIPGLLLGAWLLATLPTRGLLLLVAAAVVLAVGYRLWARRQLGTGAPPLPRKWGVAAGFVSGALGTSTTLAGPPTVYYLTGRMNVPGRIRDTLVTLNLVRLPLSVIALLAAGAFEVIAGVGWLVLAVMAGFTVGTVLYRRLNPQRYETLVLGALVLAAITAVTAAFR